MRRISKKLFNISLKHFPGGVNSPVRAFKTVGSTPLFIKKAKGSKILDVDENQYIDFICSFGPLILGHSHPAVIKAIKKVAEKGTSFGACTEYEIELASIIKKAMPSIEMLRFVNSGTEATMSAIRLARAYTGKDKIIKFEGCYHGHSDSLLVKAGSGASTTGIPTSQGVPESFIRNTISLPYNSIEAILKIFTKDKNTIAGVIVEPVAGNMGVIPPVRGFLEALREITEKNKSLLIFDEVITGFRVSFGGAQKLYKIKPDLTCLGKIIGGGLPVGAYGGKKEIMEMVSPSGNVYQAGTLSGNPLAMNAGIATLNILSEKNFYNQLEDKSERLCSGIAEKIKKHGIKASLSRFGSMFTIFFRDTPPANYQEICQCDMKKFSRFFNLLLNEGIFIPPSQFEAWFVSQAHSGKDIEETITKAGKTLTKI